MKTVTQTVYNFSELSEQAQQRAIEQNYYINVSFEWWESTYEDAQQIGLKITSFDIDRGNYCNGHLLDSATQVAYKILSEHGENCDTYKKASEFLKEYDLLVAKYASADKPNQVAEGNEYEFDQEADELEEQFTEDLCECYLSILRDEYEYQTSEEAIIETLNANAYEFTEDGEIF